MEMAPTMCYLHTMTFKGDAPDEKTAARALKSWIDSSYYRKHPIPFVWVMQKGDEFGRIHFHLVTAKKWEESRFRKAVKRNGFGRYNVRERPIERSGYAARYVGRWCKFPLAKGTRSWGVVGANRVRCVDVVKREKVLPLVAYEPQPLFDTLFWRCREYRVTITFLNRYPCDLQPVVYKMNELKPAAAKVVLAELLKGGSHAVGEYRMSDVRTLEYADKKNPGAPKIRRVIVSHTVECGNEAVTVKEWLPSGADEKSVKAPANRGDVVLVRIDSQASQFGRDREINGSITSLAVLV